MRSKSFEAPESHSPRELHYPIHDTFLPGNYWDFKPLAIHVSVVIQCRLAWLPANQDNPWGISDWTQRTPCTVPRRSRGEGLSKKRTSRHDGALSAVSTWNLHWQQWTLSTFFPHDSQTPRWDQFISLKWTSLTPGLFWCVYTLAIYLWRVAWKWGKWVTQIAPDNSRTLLSWRALSDVIQSDSRWQNELKSQLSVC